MNHLMQAFSYINKSTISLEHISKRVLLGYLCKEHLVIFAVKIGFPLTYITIIDKGENIYPQSIYAMITSVHRILRVLLLLLLRLCQVVTSSQLTFVWLRQTCYIQGESEVMALKC